MKQLVTILALLPFAACGEPPQPVDATTLDPTAVMTRFYEALCTGDRDAAMELVLPIADDAQRANMRDNLELAIEQARAGNLAQEAFEHKVQGAWAAVVTRHAFRRDGPPDVIVREEMLYRTDKGWRIVLGASAPVIRNDAAIAPLWSSDADALVDWFRTNHLQFVGKYKQRKE